MAAAKQKSEISNRCLHIFVDPILPESVPRTFLRLFSSDLGSLLFLKLQFRMTLAKPTTLHLVPAGFEHVIVRPTAL